MKQSVVIKWSGPYPLENIHEREAALSHGIYAIYRRFGTKETLLYIGKTERSILQRLKEHEKDWLYHVRGQIIIRIGSLVYSANNRFSPKRLGDVEALLIVWLCPPENTSCSVHYRGRFDLEVINIGRRGLIDKHVSAKDLIWA
jgi:hypothetical protein